MLSARSLKTWSWLHKWSSLVCTVFMLLLCLTGLPLIFEDQISEALGHEAQPPALAADAPRISLDRVMEIAQARFPDKYGRFASQSVDDDRVWYVTVSEKPPAPGGLKQVAVDARTGEVLAEPPLEGGVMKFIEHLHVDLFAGLAGMLFLGAMGLLLLVSLVSGVVLYAPFMRRLRFGEVRRGRSSWVKWLDLHNLLGIVTLVWVFVVGATGVINTLADLLVKQWQATELREMVRAYEGQPPLERPGSLQAAVRAALAHEPGMAVKFVAFPGTSFSSPHHYGVFVRGDTPLTQRITKPVLVDALTGQVTDSRDLPWYLTALQVSRPLHFGDYGGLPLQLLWAVLDVISILVLGSGLYLWWAKHMQRRRFTDFTTVGGTEPGSVATGVKA
jgi:uncharacterized iron-regulated membrane protein